ncbi:MAG: hypothetical protein Aurels2KO_38000 [Aureliella sp.]
MYKVAFALVSLAWCLPSTACADWHTVEYENVLGTSFQLKVDCDADAVAELEAIALGEVDRLSGIVSHYDPNSEVTVLLQKSRVGEPIEISATLARLLQRAEEVRTATGGAFDIRAGELKRLWQVAAETNREPTEVDRYRVAQSLAQAPYKLTGTTLVRYDSLTWSLDAIAKGTILDAVAKRLAERRPGMSGFVNIGGDIRMFGRKRVSADIENPFNHALNSDALVSVHIPAGHAICTSGGYRRGFNVGGRQLSHILDPRSGLPVANVASATVIAETAEQADALATAFSVMPIADALNLVSSTENTECLLVLDSGKVAKSDGWPRELLLGRLVSDDSKKATDEAAAKPSNATEGLIVDFTLDRPKGSRYRRPYVAVWLEDKDGFPVKTAVLWMQTEQPGPRWHRDLTRWYRNNRMRKAVEKTKLIGTISGATRGAGEYRAVFDGTDNAGKKLPSGTYTLCLEAAREHGTYQLMREKVALSDTAIKRTELKGNVEMGKVAYQYIPASASRVQ